ncbi:MAG TPA: MarR family transcriptional regulator [Mycobacteriales bacterium]|jgi:DNA-binding MarR family transcriptional regulator|nr:MarR family transcriptional regulator [Mycobacteriales bacterium]
MAKPALQPLDEREMSAWHALIRAHHRVIRRLEVELEAEHGLTLPAYEVLAHLSEAPQQRLRMSELAVHAVLTPSGLTRLVDKLSREGLVCRDRCEGDARVVYAVLTPQGRARLEEAYPTHLRGVREHYIDLLTTEQREAVADALGGVLDHSDKECEAAAAAECDAVEAVLADGSV